MRKMMLLAVMVAMAALMMAASPAMADDNDRDGFDDMTFRFVGDDFCDFFGCEDDFEEFCEEFDGDNFCDDDFNRFDFNDGFGDFEQEAESGDIDQSFDVSGTGDNSNQTVGIQGVANTGNAQNQIGVIDAGGFGDFVDFDGNDDDARFFFVGDDFCEFGDFDGDGICDRLDRLEDRFEERCEDGNNDGICDRLEERIEDLEDRIVDDGFFFVVDDFDRFDDDERFFFGNDDGGDFEFEDVGSTIEVSPTNTVTSDQQVNQAAAAFGGK